MSPSNFLVNKKNTQSQIPKENPVDGEASEDKPSSDKNAYVTKSDFLIPLKLHPDNVDPRLVNALPQGLFQLIVFELPLFLHLPLLLIYTLTPFQLLMVVENFFLSLIISIIAVDMLNRVRIGYKIQQEKENSSPSDYIPPRPLSKKEKTLYVIIAVIAIGVDFFLIARAINWMIVWTIRDYPVFTYIFSYL